MCPVSVIRPGARCFALESNMKVLPILEDSVMENWIAAGIRPDYASIRCRHDLSVPGEPEQDLVILGAGYVGNTRLIDNVEFSV